MLRDHFLFRACLIWVLVASTPAWAGSPQGPNLRQRSKAALQRPMKTIKGLWAFHSWRHKNVRVNRLYQQKVKADLKAFSGGLKWSALTGMIGAGGAAKAIPEFLNNPTLTSNLAVKGGVSLVLLTAGVTGYRMIRSRLARVREATLLEAMVEGEPIAPRAFNSLTRESRYKLIENAIDQGARIQPAALTGVNISGFGPAHRSSLQEQKLISAP